MSEKYTSDPITLPPNGSGDWQITLHGLNQAGPSFDALVFLNNPDADEETSPTTENGFVGSVAVYGYGMGPGKQRLPMDRSLEATEVVRHLIQKGVREATVTVVPIKAGTGEHQPSQLEDSLGIESVELIQK